MQEKKNKRLAVLLVVLLGITAAVFWYGKSESGYAVDPAMFKQYDLSKIDEINLESPAGKTTLKFGGARWKVNGEFNASAEMIEVLFATLQQAEAKRPAALSLRDSISATLQKKGVKVSLLAAGEQQATFFAGGNESKTQAYFLNENTNVPYVMTIPGYRVYVSGIFELLETGWRDKYVFGFNWRNFQRLETKFPKQPQMDFKVEMEDGIPVMRGMQQVDTTKLNNFLDEISLLTADEFVEANSSLDSLAKAVPLVSILVADVAGKQYFLQLYAPNKNGWYPGMINGSQWARFNKRRVEGIVRGRNFFQIPR